jgi:hypothetical protein
MDPLREGLFITPNEKSTERGPSKKALCSFNQIVQSKGGNEGVE